MHRWLTEPEAASRAAISHPTLRMRVRSRSIADGPMGPSMRMISGAILGTFVGSHRGAALMEGVGLVEPARYDRKITGGDR